MAVVEAAAPHNAGAGAPQPADREKEFFTTWLRLMERLKDAQDLTQALQSVLDQPGDVGSTLQDARHQANMLGANDKTISGLVQLLNDFFFRDIVPALKRAKTAARQQQQQQQQQQRNPLDRYLEHGDEGASMSQTFVDNMSGWAAPPGRQPTEQRKKQTAADTDDFLSDDEIPSDKFHDMLIENNLKVIAWQAPDYSAMAPPQQPATPTPATTQRGDAGDRAVRNVSQGETSKRSRVVPPPIVTDLPPRSASVGSTPRTQSRSPDASAQKDRIGKRAAADLVAQQVLRARVYGSAREYMIRWEGVAQPLWISRRKAPQQAKELIDQFSAELRAQEAEAARRAGAGQTPTRGGSAKRKATRTGARPSGAAAASKTPEAEFYTVDHIVNHRTHYNKRQYQVRWENYDASDDTWENADKLRADVPDIVDAYEAQLERDQTRAEALESAMSELNRDTAARPKSTAKKRGVAEVSAEEAANPKTLSPDRADGEQAKEKRPRIATEKENKGKDGDGGNSDEDDYQFDLEEAELEEFSEDEYADRLHA